MEYVIPPMVTAVVVKFTTPLPELLALKVPLKVAEKLSLPGIGTVCVIVSVKVPEALIDPLPLKKVWKLPKLEPVGVSKLVEPRPVNVIMRALPMFRNVTELVPLPPQPAHVKVPDVEKVTGSALASEELSVIIATSNVLSKVALKMPAMLAPLFHLESTSAPALQEERLIVWFLSTRFKVDDSTAAGQTRLWNHLIDSYKKFEC